MSTTTFFIVLVAGGLLTSALCGLLLPERTGGLANAIWSGTIITVIAGVAITEFLGASNEIGLAAIAVGPIAVVSGFGNGGSGSGSGSDSGWGFGDSGGSDSGGGGGCGGGGGD